MSRYLCIRHRSQQDKSCSQSFGTKGKLLIDMMTTTARRKEHIKTQCQQLSGTTSRADRQCRSNFGLCSTSLQFNTCPRRTSFRRTTSRWSKCVTSTE